MADPPRGRIGQDDAFGLEELVGSILVDATAYSCEHADQDAVDILVMAFEHTPWVHRFFLDAGLGFWEEWSLSDAIADYEDCQRIDVGTQYQLVGRPLVGARCVGSPGHASQVEFRFPHGQLLLACRVEHDWESESVLRFSPSA